MISFNYGTKMAKPIPEQLFNKYLKILGLRLEKGSIDYKLYQGDLFLCAIKIMHGGGREEKFRQTVFAKQ